MTDLQLAQMCQALYAAPNPWLIGGIAYSVIDNTICCRGSEIDEDWIRDFEAVPVHTPLGTLHKGFWEGIESLYAAILHIQKPIITGHSLGGAHARILAGMFVQSGNIPTDLCTFASPRPGMDDFKALINSVQFPHRNYRYMNDPVPMVPIPIPFIEHWEHTEPNTELRGPAHLNVFEDHHIANYLGALQVV